MPKACGFVDFKAVMFFQLELTPAFGFRQLSGTVTPQNLYGAHLFGSGDLFFGDSGHGNPPFLLK